MRIIRETLADIEHERRIGYAWLGFWPRTLIETEYPAWRARHARCSQRFPDAQKCVTSGTNPCDR